MKTSVHFLWYVAHFFLEWEMFQTKVLETTERHVLFHDFCNVRCDTIM